MKISLLFVIFAFALRGFSARPIHKSNVKEDIFSCLIDVVVKLATCLIGDDEYLNEHFQRSIVEALKSKYDNKQSTNGNREYSMESIEIQFKDGGGASADNATMTGTRAECFQKAGMAALSCLFFDEDVALNLNNDNEERLDLDAYLYKAD